MQPNVSPDYIGQSAEGQARKAACANNKSRLDRSGLNGINASKIETIKEAKAILTIRALWAHHGLNGSPGRSCLSPFRHESNPSFSVYIGDNGEERFNDFGDADMRGDSFDFFKRCTGLEGREAVQAFLELAEHYRKEGFVGETADPVKSKEPKRKPLPRNFPDLCAKRIKMLGDNPGLADSYARKRGWKRETILKLAREGCLGWRRHYGAVFIYPTGIKYRVDVGGERFFPWEEGHAGFPWRNYRIANASKVYVAEGETDCITLIDAGLENDPGIAVVALPSATIYKFNWSDLIAGKEVTLCMDNDEAGNYATDALVGLIHPHAQKLNILNWKGILNERR